MDILRLRPITSHVRVKLSCDNYRQGKFGKFIKSKFKILTCVVLLGRLNTMRGISAGKYDKGNKSIMMRGIWVGEIYILLSTIYLLSQPRITLLPWVKTTTNFSNICFLLLTSFLIRFLYIFFVGGFNRRCSYDQAVLSKFLNPHPFIQKSHFKCFISIIILIHKFT